MRKTLTALAAAAAISAVSVSPAAAQDTGDKVSVTIQAEDLDLTATEDQSRLDNRVQTAIRRACRSGGRDLASRQVETACRASLVDAIAPRVELAIAKANETQFAAIELSFEG